MRCWSFAVAGFFLGAGDETVQQLFSAIGDVPVSGRYEVEAVVVTPPLPLMPGSNMLDAPAPVLHAAHWADALMAGVLPPIEQLEQLVFYANGAPDWGVTRSVRSVFSGTSSVSVMSTGEERQELFVGKEFMLRSLGGSGFALDFRDPSLFLFRLEDIFPVLKPHALDAYRSSRWELALSDPRSGSDVYQLVGQSEGGAIRVIRSRGGQLPSAVVMGTPSIRLLAYIPVFSTKDPPCLSSCYQFTYSEGETFRLARFIVRGFESVEDGELPQLHVSGNAHLLDLRLGGSVHYTNGFEEWPQEVWSLASRVGESRDVVHSGHLYLLSGIVVASAGGVMLICGVVRRLRA